MLRIFPLEYPHYVLDDPGHVRKRCSRSAGQVRHEPGVGAAEKGSVGSKGFLGVDIQDRECPRVLTQPRRQGNFIQNNPSAGVEKGRVVFHELVLSPVEEPVVGLPAVDVDAQDIGLREEFLKGDWLSTVTRGFGNLQVIVVEDAEPNRRGDFGYAAADSSKSKDAQRALVHLSLAADGVPQGGPLFPGDESFEFDARP